LTGDSANATGSNIGATGEVGEPTQSGATNSVWWTWTAPSTGTFTIDTIGSGYDTWLTLFNGYAVDSLTPIAYNDDGGGNLTSLINLNATAGETYQIAVEGYYDRTGPIQLNIAPGYSGLAPDGNLTDTANADSINGLPNAILANAANNTLKGADKDPLTGGWDADTRILPFAGSSVSAIDPVTDFGRSEEKNSLTPGGAAIDPPSLFSPAPNRAVTTLEKDVSPVFSEEKGVSPVFANGNGALAGNPALGSNSDPFRVPADPYLVPVFEPKRPAFSVA